MCCLWKQMCIHIIKSFIAHKKKWLFFLRNEVELGLVQIISLAKVCV